MRSVINSNAQDVAHTIFTTNSSLKDQKAYSVSEVMLLHNQDVVQYRKLRIIRVENISCEIFSC